MNGRSEGADANQSATDNAANILLSRPQGGWRFATRPAVHGGDFMAGTTRKAMNNYVAVLEQGPKNWSAYAPDLPGCVAVGITREETEGLVQEAIEFHVEGLLLDGMPLPKPCYDAQKRGPAAV